MSSTELDGSSSSGSHGPVGDDGQVILQGFNWECHTARDPSWWTILKFKAAAIAEAKITCIWLPPPSVSVSPEVGGWPANHGCAHLVWPSIVTITIIIVIITC